MTPTKTIPNALRVAFVAFAVFQVIGLAYAIVSGQIPWYFGLAALPIPAAWALVGYWGGLPLVSTGVPLREHGPQKALELQLAVIRRRKRIANWAVVVWFPLAAIAMMLYLPVGIAVFVSGALLSGMYAFLWQFSKCPQCHHGFNAQTYRGLLYWNTRKCQHCGLPLKDSEHETSA